MSNSCEIAYPKCKAYCCKMVGFTFKKGDLSSDQIEYYKMHEGIGVFHKSVGEQEWILIIVKAKCKNIKEDLTCGDYDNRPLACKVGYNQIKKGVVFIDGCVFTPGKESLCLSVEEIKEVFGDDEKRSE